MRRSETRRGEARQGEAKLRGGERRWGRIAKARYTEIYYVDKKQRGLSAAMIVQRGGRREELKNSAAKHFSRGLSCKSGSWNARNITDDYFVWTLPLPTRTQFSFRRRDGLSVFIPPRRTAERSSETGLDASRWKNDSSSPFFSPLLFSLSLSLAPCLSLSLSLSYSFSLFFVLRYKKPTYSFLWCHAILLFF